MHAAIEALSHGGSRPQPHSAAIVQGRLTHADIVSAAVLLIVTLAVRGVWFGNPIADFDEQLYSLIGWRMTLGDLPFVDLWDRKPFGLFAIFAAAHGLFGPSVFAYQALAMGFALSGAWLVYILAHQLVDRGSATVAGMLYLMLLSAYGSYTAQSEVFHTPLMLFAVWLLCGREGQFSTRRALWAMLVMGMALQVKYTVLPQCLLLGAYALYSAARSGMTARRVVALAAAFAALGILPTAIVALFYLAQGGFDAFWFANFVSFFDRAPSQFGRLWPGHVRGAVPIWGLCAVGIYAALRLNPPRNPRLYAFYCGWGLSALATVLMPATVYLYYYGALAPAAVLVALPLIDRTGRAGWLPAAMLIGAMLYITNPPANWWASRESMRTEQRLTRTITPLVGRDKGCLWIYDGPSVLYRTTGSCLPTRFIYPDHLNNNMERGALGISQAAEVRRILARKPPVIITADAPVTPQNPQSAALVEEALARHYKPLIREKSAGRLLTAWQRTKP